MSVPVPVFGGGPGSGHYPPLLIVNNLSDIQSIPTALANLGIGAISTVGTVTSFPGSVVVPSGITMQNLTASVVVSTSGGVLGVVTASGAAVTGNFKPTSFYPVTIQRYDVLCTVVQWGVVIESNAVQHLVAILTEQRNRALDTLAETGAKLMAALEAVAAKENELQTIKRQLELFLKT